MEKEIIKENINIKPVGGNSSNVIADIIRGIAIIDFIASFILFLAFIEQIVISVTYLVGGLVAGFILLGFAEIIYLLQLKQNQCYIIEKEKIIINNSKKNEEIVVKDLKKDEQKEKVLVEEKKETNHTQIIDDIEKLDDINKINNYLCLYTGYKDELFEKMLNRACELKNSNDKKYLESIKKDFIADYKMEISKKKTQEYLAARTDLMNNSSKN